MTLTQSDKHYRDFQDFISQHFDGKVQKISVNAGLGCPNRDGTIGIGGCTYCNNASFTPGYTSETPSVKEQLEKGIRFFRRKYPKMKYLAYFQSYTNTHGSIEKLLGLYEEALSMPEVVGLIIATRPDCMPDTLLCELSRLRSRNFIMIEYGAESSHDSTLRLINRCHTWNDTVEAVRRTKNSGIPTGLHIINGLPGEEEKMMLDTVDNINMLPVDTVKFHQLQVIRGTKLHRDIEDGKYDVLRWSAEEYARLCKKIVKKIRKDISIERFVSQSPEEMLIFPRWGLKNYQFTNLLNNLLKADEEVG